MDEFYEAIDELEKRTLTILQSPTPIDALSKSSNDPKNPFSSPESPSREEQKEQMQADLYAIEEVNETIIDEESKSSKMSKLGWTGRTEQAAKHESPFKDKNMIKRFN